MSVLRFADASKRYGLTEQTVLALDSVSLEIRQGEFVALVGRSGCGKSTFLNLAGAMDLPTSGDVLIAGASTKRLNDEELTEVRRKQVGFVFQFFQLLPALSAAENVELPLQLAGRLNVRRRALEMLDLVGIAECAGRLPYQLSGGQMQRVAIARALVHAPALLLADEPLGNLDTETSASILDLLDRIHRELGSSIVMATHSTESAARANRVLRLRDGRLVEGDKDPPRPL